MVRPPAQADQKSSKAGSSNDRLISNTHTWKSVSQHHLTTSNPPTSSSFTSTPLPTLALTQTSTRFVPFFLRNKLCCLFGNSERNHCPRRIIHPAPKSRGRSCWHDPW